MKSANHWQAGLAMTLAVVWTGCGVHNNRLPAKPPPDVRSVKGLEEMITRPLSPSSAQQMLAILDSSKPSGPGGFASTWHRARAAVLAQISGAAWETIDTEIEAALGAVAGESGDEGKRCRAKALLNRANNHRVFLERELQRGVVYGLPPESFFELLKRYGAPAEATLTEVEALGVGDLAGDLKLDRGRLLLTMAEAARTFLPSDLLSRKWLEEAGLVFREVKNARESDGADQGIRMAAHNGLGMVLLALRAPETECVSLASEIETLLQDANAPITWRAALCATELNLLRCAKSPRLSDAIKRGKAIFQQVLAEQAGMNELGMISSSSAFFDDMACLASGLVLAQVQAGDVMGAFETIQRAKWTSHTSSIRSGASIAKLQERLKHDRALLVEWYLTPEGLLTFLANGEGPITVQKLETVGPVELAGKICAYLSQMGSQSSIRLAFFRGRPQLLVEAYDRGRELKELLLDATGVAAEIKRLGAKVLYIAPHMVLSYVPWSGLPVATQPEPPFATRFVLEEFPAIAVVPSSLLLAEEPGGSGRCARAVYFVRSNFHNVEPTYGSDLPGITEEVNRCQTVLPGKLYRESGATKEAFWREGPTADVIYFATHGIVKVDDPLQSHVLLAKDDQTDGFLRVGELLARGKQARLHANLVVFSACVTGLSESKPFYSDDLNSMCRAMLAAGSRKVVATLWEASDQSYPVLMPRMLDLVRGGVVPPLALQQSQKEFLDAMRKEQSPMASAFFWASAVVYQK